MVVKWEFQSPIVATNRDCLERRTQGYYVITMYEAVTLKTRLKSNPGVIRRVQLIDAFLQFLKLLRRKHVLREQAAAQNDRN